MAEPWRQGMTRGERGEAREAFMDWHAEHGHDEDHELAKLTGPGCRPGSPCTWEQPGGPGCPGEAHDPMADQVAELTEALRERQAVDRG